MKKICFLFGLTLLLTLTVTTPAMATTEYDMDTGCSVIYDETKQLGSQYLTMQGEQTLPELSETLGLDLRVDVLTMIDDDTIGETAGWIYDTYGYGWGDHREGATLTILMEPTEDDTYAMPADGWCIYTTLRQGRGNSQDLADAIRDAVEPSMAEQAWNGEDLTMSATALTQAVDAMAEAASDYILANCPPDSLGPEALETPETSETSAPSDVSMQYVFDISNLLTYEEWEELESRAADMSYRHHCGVYFALVDDYTEYGADGIYEVTCQLYHNSELGFGYGRDGIIVLLSMEERDYAMFVYGEYAEYAFDEFGQRKLEERFLEAFGEDDWQGGISDYLDACDEFLTKAGEGKPVRSSPWLMVAAAVGISCLIAGGICFFLLSSMKSVHQKKEADVYLTEGGLHLTEQYDQYTHTTETRTKIEKESSSESGGGGSGRSGKF